MIDNILMNYLIKYFSIDCDCLLTTLSMLGYPDTQLSLLAVVLAPYRFCVPLS